MNNTDLTVNPGARERYAISASYKTPNMIAVTSYALEKTV